MSKSKAGFTLVELLVVVVFVAIILSIAGCGIMVFKGCQKVQKDGVQNIAEGLWKGNTNEADNSVSE